MQQVLRSYVASLQSPGLTRSRWPLTPRATVAGLATAMVSLVVLVSSIVLLPDIENKAPQAVPKASTAKEVSRAKLGARTAQLAQWSAPVQNALRVLMPTPSTTTPQPSDATLPNVPVSVAARRTTVAAKTPSAKRGLPVLSVTAPPATRETPASVPQSILTATLKRSESAPVQQRTRSAADLGAQDPALQETDALETQTLKAVVAAGDSLSSLFSKFDLSQTDLALMLQTSTQNKRRLSRLSPGQQLEMQINNANRLEKFVLHLDPLEALHLTRRGDRFTAEIVRQPIEWREATAKGVITSSLYDTAQQAKVSPAIIDQLTDILGWDIDFARDVRSGDQFKLIYLEPYVKQRRVGGGRILALEFINRGKIIRAVSYTFADGRIQYFTPDGLSMRKTFLRSPVHFSRISSRFNLKRFHPVLHKVRAHRGVDYAAARGTPVKATADGRITYIGWNGGYGRTLKIQHGANYTTLYAHLLRYKKRMANGKRVRQGNIIGYVGKSGLATGHHLHYEFRVKGVHKDPLRFDFPAGEPISDTLKARFLAEARGLIEQLDAVSSDARFAALSQ